MKDRISRKVAKTQRNDFTQQLKPVVIMISDFELGNSMS